MFLERWKEDRISKGLYMCTYTHSIFERGRNPCPKGLTAFCFLCRTLGYRKVHLNVSNLLSHETKHGRSCYRYLTTNVRISLWYLLSLYDRLRSGSIIRARAFIRMLQRWEKERGEGDGCKKSFHSRCEERFPRLTRREHSLDSRTPHERTISFSRVSRTLKETCRFGPLGRGDEL